MTRRLTLTLSAALISLATPAVHADDAAPAAIVQKTAKPGTVSASSVEKFTATVTAVDLAARTVTLKGKGGGEETFYVSEDVKRFDAVKVGDLVAVTYKRGLALSLQAPGATDSQTSVTVSGKPEAGARPGGDVKATVKATVTIAAIDLKTRVVTLVGPKGNKLKVKAADGVQLDKVKVGDKLSAEYTESLAIAVEPAAKKAK